jgi:hypothetical protein
MKVVVVVLLLLMLSFDVFVPTSAHPSRSWASGLFKQTKNYFVKSYNITLEIS